MNPEAESRAAFEQLMQEFASASSDDAPILHQRLSGIQNQVLTKKTWEDFRLANYLGLGHTKRGEWQKWVPHPDGLACSRFVGSGDKGALDLFRRLADTGIALLRAALNTGGTWHFDPSIVEQIEREPSDEKYLLWLEVLHLTAKQCRTLFLHVTVGNWSYSRSPGETIENAASEMSLPTEFGLSAFPIHPIVDSLQHDIFRSSAEAIGVWIAANNIKRVGEWPDRPPIYLPPLIQGHQQEADREEDHALSSVVAPGEQPGPSTSPTPAANQLVIDPETFTVSYGKTSDQWDNALPFHLLKRLNKRPGTPVSLSALRDDVWKDVNLSDDTIQKQVSLLRQKLKDGKFKGVTIDGKTVRGHYRLILAVEGDSPASK